MPSDAPMPVDGVTLMDPHTSKTNQCSNKNSKKVSGAKETMSIFYGHAQRPHRCCHFCLRLVEIQFFGKGEQSHKRQGAPDPYFSCIHPNETNQLNSIHTNVPKGDLCVCFRCNAF